MSEKIRFRIFINDIDTDLYVDVQDHHDFYSEKEIEKMARKKVEAMVSLRKAED